MNVLSEASIVVFGRDPKLLETRRWVLEHAGARVWTVTALSQFELVEPGKPVDVLILCHSLHGDQCAPAIELAEARWPGIKSLGLIAGMHGCHLEHLDEKADTTQGPAHLVQAVAELVDDPG
jgi:hypothetical protein